MVSYSYQKFIEIPPEVSLIYDAVEKLERKYPGRKFTPDGHLVGSIGEVIAAEAFDLELFEMSEIAHDAARKDGKKVQIKLTAGRSVSLRHDCELLLIMRIVSTKLAGVIYYGDGSKIWNACGPMQSNGQRNISLSKIIKIRELEL